MATLRVNVFPERDRPAKITVAQDGEPLEFVSGGTTRMLVQFEESLIEADSSVDSSLITWNDNGEVFFDFGELGLPIGLYVGTLIVFDPAHPDGQPVISKADGNILEFNVVGEPTVTIIVEDGTNVVGANSYNSIADVRQYAMQRGFSLPVDNEVVAAWMLQSMDYIESKACEYQGSPTYPDQELSWPRSGVVISCKEIAEDSIPKQLKAAQSQLVMAVQAGIDIFPNFQLSDYMNFVIEKTVGPITKKYADPSKMLGFSVKPQMSAVDAMLKPLMFTCAEATFKTIRV